MAKYLWEVSYTQRGVQGVMKEGGTSRRVVVEKLVQNMGGTLEAFYYSFGENDVYVIADFPNNIDAAAVSMNVAATGAANVKTVVLLSPEDIDEASQRAVDYRPPGD
jgi:uncharacterized protein with GYD domain